MEILRGSSKLSFFLVLGLTVVCCYSQAHSGISQATSSSKSTSIRKEERAAVVSENATEQAIWTGEVADLQIRWTSRDIYVDDQTLLAPHLRKEFEAFAAELRKDVRPGEQMLHCDYNRYFSIVSLVGPLATLEDRSGVVCGMTSVGLRFTVLNLKNRQGRQTAAALSWNDNGSVSRNKIRLSDYFDEATILRSLLSNPLIRESLESQPAAAEPQTLAQVSTFFEDHPAAIKSDGAYFSLPADFLSSFAFDHLANNVVSVRIPLEPASQADRGRYAELELLLPVPKSLEKPLSLAASRKEGFLMKDAAEIGQDRITTFSFKTP